MDPYEVLGLNSSASQEDVKKRFYELAKKYHPDTCVSDEERKKAEVHFAEITQAYNAIKNISLTGKKKIKKSDEDFDEKVLQRAKVLISSGDFNSAIKLLSNLNDALKREAEFLLGEAYMKKERYHDALKHFKAAYDLNQWDVVVRLKIAYVFEKIGLKNSARKEYEEILSIDPSNVKAYERLSALDKKGFSLKDLFKKD